MTRIAVLGAGAMGSIFGAALAEAGYNVVLIDVSEPLVEAIRREGLSIEGDTGTRTVQVDAVTDPSGLQPVDLLIVFVKGYHTEAALELARPVIGDGTIVASLQNGWGNGDVIAARVRSDRVVVGVTNHSGTLLDLAKVAHTGRGATYVGPFTETEDTTSAAFTAEVLNRAGFETTTTPRIRDEVWKKLVLNAAALPTAALTRLTAEELAQPGPVLDLIFMAADETVAVAQAAGYELDVDERRAYIHGLLQRGGKGKASMLQDVEAGRRTEIDTVNGAVVRTANEHGMRAAVNEVLFALVHGYERSQGLRS